MYIIVTFAHLKYAYKHTLILIKTLFKKILSCFFITTQNVFNNKIKISLSHFFITTLVCFVQSHLSLFLLTLNKRKEGCF